MPDCRDLSRFVDAQALIFATALAELRAGRKRSHWMWFVFRQLDGLGSSPTAPLVGSALRCSVSFACTASNSSRSRMPFRMSRFVTMPRALIFDAD